MDEIIVRKWKDLSEAARSLQEDKKESKTWQILEQDNLLLCLQAEVNEALPSRICAGLTAFWAERPLWLIFPLHGDAPDRVLRGVLQEWKWI